MAAGRCRFFLNGRSFIQWFSEYGFPGAHAVSNLNHHPVLPRKEMINTATKHDKPDPLSALQPLIQAQMAYDPPRQIACYLDERMVAVTVIFNSNQISLVVRACGISKGGPKLAPGICQHRDAAG